MPGGVNTAAGGMNATGFGGATNSQAPPAMDINTLAAALQQAQKALANANAGKDQGAQHQSQHVVGAGDNKHSNVHSGGNMGSSGAMDQQQQQGQPDVQAILVEMQRLKNERDTFLKSLEDEKEKSKILVADKKKEMESFLGGISDYVNGLEGVKDPESKKKFMEGIKNMANHGVPNGIFDIMVSASAQNQLNIKTIETLTQV